MIYRQMDPSCWTLSYCRDSMRTFYSIQLVKVYIELNRTKSVDSMRDQSLSIPI